MNILLFDAFCAVLIVAGLVIAFRNSGSRGSDDPRTYVRRIAGIMLMAFGLAIGVMVTVFYSA